MRLKRMLQIISNSKHMYVVYLFEINYMMNLLVTKVFKSIRSFNSKLMIISITHRIMDTKLCDY